MSGSFKKYQGLIEDMEAGGRAAGNDVSELDRFVHDVDTIKDDMKIMEKLHKRLQDSNEQSKTIHGASKAKELRAIMDSDIDHVLILAKSIMRRLESLERYNSAPGAVSSIDRNRITVVMGLGKKLRDVMDEFQGLRVKIAAAYKEIVEFKYYSITGEREYVETIEKLVSSGEIEAFVHEAIQEHGTAQVLDIVKEIQERREGAKYMQKNLVDLHQIFLDMVALVEIHGQRTHQHDQNHMARDNSFIRPGMAQLQDPEDYEKDAKKRGTIGVILVIVLVTLLLVPLFQWEAEKGRE